VKILVVRFVLVKARWLCDDDCSNVMLRGIRWNDRVVRVLVLIRVCDAICKVSASRRALISVIASSSLTMLVAMHWLC
jgi:hypothetical protein